MTAHPRRAAATSAARPRRAGVIQREAQGRVSAIASRRPGAKYASVPGMLALTSCTAVEPPLLLNPDRSMLSMPAPITTAARVDGLVRGPQRRAAHAAAGTS